MCSICELLISATFKSEIKKKAEQMELFRKDSLDGELATLARGGLV